MSANSPTGFWDEEIASWDRSRYRGRGPIEARHRLALEALTRPLQSQKQLTVVEVGCGSARMAEPLLRAGAASYRGYDISEVAVALAKKRIADLGLSDRAQVECVDLTKKAVPQADLLFSLGLIDWIAPDRLASVLSSFTSPLQLHSFSEYRLASAQQWFHRVYSLARYDWRWGGYRPRYRAATEIEAAFGAGLAGKRWSITRDPAMAFSTFIHRLE